ncbi:LOW QUALITY PROTEIN: hypothetical protein SBY92_004072 [Candida maltosa Xu316]
MSEKKRFGSRISSIFNHHSSSSPPPQSPNASQHQQPRSLNHKTSIPNTNNNVSPPTSNTRPLNSTVPLTTPNYNNSRPQISTKSSSRSLNPNPNLNPTPNTVNNNNYNNNNNNVVVTSPVQYSNIARAKVDQQSPQYLSHLSTMDSPSSRNSLSPISQSRSPKSPRRKPPSDMDMDSFNFNTNTNTNDDDSVDPNVTISSESQKSLTSTSNEDIDNFLRTSTSTIPESKGMVGLSSVVNQAPYPLDSPLESPLESPVESPHIIQNEFMPITSNSLNETNPFSSPPISTTPSTASPVQQKFANAQSPPSTSLPPLANVPSRSYTQRTYGSVKSHRISSSVGSIYSSNSNVNLATLKKSLQLKPGEGERSNYVLSIRRAAGTSYNEQRPSKLPVGILPVDKAATKENSNGKYMRLAGSQLSASRKKTSGVELKHGHLKPRLLAAEVGEADNDATLIGVSKSNSATGGSTFVSRDNSLMRTTTDMSFATGDTQSITTTTTDTNTGGAGSIKRNASISSSNSSGSLSDKNFSNLGYYQHRGYRMDDDDDEDDEDGDHLNGNDHNSSVDNNGADDTEDERMNGSPFGDPRDEEDERPRLVLANPDTDSD